MLINIPSLWKFSLPHICLKFKSYKSDATHRLYCKMLSEMKRNGQYESKVSNSFNGSDRYN